MIKIKVSELMGKHKMTNKQLSELTSIRPNTVSTYYHETVKHIDVEHLNVLCKTFNCKIEDIIEYIPDLKDK